MPFYDRGDLVAITVRHRAAQHAVRHRADLPDPVAVPRQPALRAHRRGHHSGRAVPGRDHHGAARRIRPICCRSAPSISASSSTPPSSWWRTSSAISPITRAARSPTARPSLSDKLHRILTAAVEVDKRDLLLGHHHHRGVPAAVHHAGRRRPDFRPDVAHLCLCAARRGDRDLHGDAGDVVGPAARQACSEIETFLVRHIRRSIKPSCRCAVRNARIAGDDRGRPSWSSAACSASRLGTEFLPKLEEGNLWIRALLPPTITLEAGMETVARSARSS